MNSAGALVFVIATTNNTPIGDYRVRITVDAANAARGAAPAAAQTREATFTLASTAPARSDVPPNTLVVTVAPGVTPTVTRSTFLPITRSDIVR